MIGLIENTGPAGAHGDLVSLVDQVFQRGGWLETELGLAHRPQQHSMALSVAAALEGDSPLLVEAGTGVGKGLAYLIPGLIRAQLSKRTCVVSTHTITLQEQLRGKDLTLCRKLFETVGALRSFAGFKTALMVGKGNYCCSTRLQRALDEAGKGSQTRLFDSSELRELKRIAAWAKTSPDGLRQELSPAPDPAVWDAVNADASACTRKHCDPARCPYQRARRRLHEAHCVIVNHSLLFSLINAGAAPNDEQRGILMPDDFVILDEAHTVPAVATEHLGTALSSFAAERMLKRLYNPAKGTGLLAAQLKESERALVDEALDACRVFFDFLGAEYLAKDPLRAIRQADFTENITSEPLLKVLQLLKRLLDKEEDEGRRDELQDQRRRVSALRECITTFIVNGDDKQVQWLERSGRRQQIVALRSAPVEIAPVLKDVLFQCDTGVVLTSATLSNGTHMDAFREKVGAYAAECCIETSPFDYDANCHLYLATDCPRPDGRVRREHIDYLVDCLQWLTLGVSGGTLALFTAYTDLRAVDSGLRAAVERAGRRVLSQGDGIPRSRMTAEFAACGNALLLGTDSFWTGVDIPGPALSQVVICKLPFENPGHPVAEARSEALRNAGEDPFTRMTLPDAVIKFRQGMGRLIRRQDDRGRIVILDSRIVTHAYGHHFIASFPTANYTRFNRFNRDSILRPV